MTSSKNCLSVKVNLGRIADLPHAVIWDEIVEKIVKPFEKFIKSRKNGKVSIEVKASSYGIHTNGKSVIPHVHMNYLLDTEIKNPLANYKYWYFKNVNEETHFKLYKHSIKSSILFDKLMYFLAYPLKECVDEENMWKAWLYPKSDIPVDDLIKCGAGLYITACRNRAKNAEKEELKLEKWGNFCKYMDDLRNTPTKNEMYDLRGVCLLALDYFRNQPERTSVNAVITMCKDYAFKRNIWTNQQILDKFQIC
jgi:hypothetical protein